MKDSSEIREDDNAKKIVSKMEITRHKKEHTQNRTPYDTNKKLSRDYEDFEHAEEITDKKQ